MEPAIELHGVGKRYWKMEQQAMLLKSVLPFARPKRTEMWALRNLNISVGQGETVGIVGRNGAGKTTLLRLLAGVSQPTEGNIRVRGRIAPLISLGLGFHQEMSGRENVLVNGVLLGLTSAEVAERFDDIVAFAEIGDFIDTPIKFYSSGMFMRLAFAVLIHSEPQILLVDEVLAVGDLAFQKKSFDRMKELREQGTSVVMVSHSMYSIRQVAARAIVIRNGNIEFDGDVEGAISHYYSMLETADTESGEPAATVVSTELLGPAGASHHASYDDELEFVARFKFLRRQADPNVLFGVSTDSGLQLSISGTTPGRIWRTFEPGDQTEVRVPFRARLGGGSYRLRIALKETGGDLLAAAETMIFVTPRAGMIGTADLCNSIEIDGQDLTNRDAPMSGGR